MSRAIGTVKTTPRVTWHDVDLAEVRSRVAAFEAAHPDVRAENYPDAFRDESGQLIESEEFFAISSLYGSKRHGCDVVWDYDTGAAFPRPHTT